MKKIIAFILACSMIFCFASCAKDKPENTVNESTTSAENNNSVEKKNAVEFLSVYTEKAYEYETYSEDYYYLTQVNYQKLHLSEENEKEYPRLAKALDSFNAYKTEFYKDKAKELDEYASEQLNYYYEDGEQPAVYTANNEYFLQRADNVVLSIRSDADEFSGGAHPNYGYSGYSFDTVTGKELVITDVMTDISSLPKILSEKINSKDKFADGFFGSLEETLSEYTAEQFNWTIGYQGITFYFSPSEIASFAAGLITATVYYDEYPELFNKKYTVAPESYAVALSEWNDVEFDMNPSDGKKDAVSVGLSYFTEEGSYKDISLNLNGDEFTVEDVYAFSAEYYLVNSNGRYFIYLVPHGYNDYTNILIYDLNGNEIKEAGELDRTAFGSLVREDENKDTHQAKLLFNNPTQFVLETTFDILGTYAAYKNYTVNSETGMPESTDELYTIDKKFAHVLTSKEAFNVKILPDMKTELIKAGSKFTLLRTDGKTYVDAKLGDGRECRINVERNRTDYQLCINGTPEYELFEEIYYAG
ncbi:MAG: DUF3298 domain-containing protein [Clostridia bacterium]|nr:DUF3298 domain-containing protein [Clostridia bacterium]